MQLTKYNKTNTKLLLDVIYNIPNYDKVVVFLQNSEHFLFLITLKID